VKKAKDSYHGISGANCPQTRCNQSISKDEMRNILLKAEEFIEFQKMEEADETEYRMLIYKQKNKLPEALYELKKRNKKVGHWIWWAMPTA
jgi:hypothetical protein